MGGLFLKYPSGLHSLVVEKVYLNKISRFIYEKDIFDIRHLRFNLYKLRQRKNSKFH